MSNYQKDMAKYIIQNGIVCAQLAYYGSRFVEPNDPIYLSDFEKEVMEHVTDNKPNCGKWIKAYNLQEFYGECFAGTFTDSFDKAYAVRIKVDCECGEVVNAPIVVNGTFEEVLHGVLGIDTSDVNLLD